MSDHINPNVGHCNTVDQTPDLWLRDNLADDGIEPSSGEPWLSPDVWNRETADDGLDHQSPVIGQQNAIYARLSNRTAAKANANAVDVWVAPMATSLEWPTSFEYVGRIPGPNIVEGRIIGPLNWTPHNPYPATDFSFYARVVSPHDPVTVTETSDVAENARQNNNIAWRNVSTPRVEDGELEESFFVANTGSEAVDVEINLNVPEVLIESGEVLITLPPNFSRLQGAANNKGKGYLDITAAEESDHVSVSDLVRVLHAKSTKISLGEVSFAPGQEEAFALSIMMAPGSKVAEPIDIVQRIDGRVVGGIRYFITHSR